MPDRNKGLVMLEEIQDLTEQLRYLYLMQEQQRARTLVETESKAIIKAVWEQVRNKFDFTPEYAQALNDLGKILFLLGCRKEAEKVFDLGYFADDSTALMIKDYTVASYIHSRTQSYIKTKGLSFLGVPFFIWLILVIILWPLMPSFIFYPLSFVLTLIFSVLECQLCHRRNFKTEIVTCHDHSPVKIQVPGENH
ncbi:MAG: hypothetical protein ACFFFO_15850 [Candidatus Thorarchaeota archaeon]